MKYKYEKQILDLTYRQYRSLQEEEDYRTEFNKADEMEKGLRLMSKTYANAHKKPDSKWFTKSFLLHSLKLEIKEKWKLRMLIDPDLKVKREDFDKSIRPNSSVAKIIYALDTDSNPALVSPPKAKRTTSERIAERNKKNRKMLCYNLYKIKHSYRAVADELKIDKGTVKSDVKEVNSWSQDERDAVSTEYMRSKIMTDKDVLGDIEDQEMEKETYTKISPLQTTTPLHKVEEMMDTKGNIVKTGRKSKHRPPDESDEDD